MYCKGLQKPEGSIFGVATVRVEIVTGSLAALENLFPPNNRYRYRLETQTNAFNHHYRYRYRLGVRSHPFISIGSQFTILKVI